MSTLPEILPAMPLVSGLPDARRASAMGGIDPGASPEPVPRSALVSAEPFANPARARRVAGAAPMDGPETDKKSETAETAPKLWIVPFGLFLSRESNSAPGLPDQIAISTRAINERAKAPKYPMVVYCPPREVAGSETEDDFDSVDGRGYPTENEEETCNIQEELQVVARNAQAFGAQPHPDDEVEQEELRTVFGIELHTVFFQAFKGSKPPPKVNWSRVGRMPQPAAAARSRYPVRAGAGKRDFGEYRPVLSDDCSDRSSDEEEEADEGDEMIDDIDTPEEIAALERKAARKAAKKAAKKAKKAAEEVIDLTGDSA